MIPKCAHLTVADEFDGLTGAWPWCRRPHPSIARFPTGRMLENRTSHLIDRGRYVADTTQSSSPEAATVTSKLACAMHSLGNVSLPWRSQNVQVVRTLRMAKMLGVAS